MLPSVDRDRFFVLAPEVVLDLVAPPGPSGLGQAAGIELDPGADEGGDGRGVHDGWIAAERGAVDSCAFAVASAIAPSPTSVTR